MSDLMPSAGICFKFRAMERLLLQAQRIRELEAELARVNRELRLLHTGAEMRIIENDRDEARQEVERLKAELADERLVNEHSNELIGQYQQTETKLREALRKLVEASRDLMHGSMESAKLWAAAARK